MDGGRAGTCYGQKTVALRALMRCHWTEMTRTAITAALIAPPNMVGELAECHNTLTAHSPEHQKVLLE